MEAYSDSGFYLDRIAATTVLHGLLDNTLQNYEVEGVSDNALKAVQLCLDAGADLTAPLVSLDPNAAPVSVLAGCVHRPQAAILLLQAGAPIEPDIVLALSQVKDPPVNQEDVFIAFKQMAKMIATQAPHLAWHAPVKSYPGMFHDYIPACMDIEDGAQGFNAALEAAQARAGLPVGCLPHIQSKEDRELALADLVMGYPNLFYLGDRPRVEVLRELMRDDIPVDMIAEGPTPDNPDKLPITLLESFLGNTPDKDVVVELLNRGATVSQKALDAISYVSAGSKSEESRREVFQLLLSHPQANLDEPYFRDTSLSLREYLRGEDPETMAIFESQEIDSQTPGSPSRPRGARL